MMICKRCQVEIKEIITNGTETFCSIQCRNDWFFEILEQRIFKIQFQYNQILQGLWLDIHRIVKELSKDWEIKNLCSVCGKPLRNKNKYCSKACKQKAYRKRLAA